MATKTREKVTCSECGRAIGKAGLRMHVLSHAPRERQKDNIPQPPPPPEPGSYVGSGAAMQKVAYTMRTLEEKYGLYEWEPQHSIPIIFNGVRIDVEEGKLVKTPKIFYDIYRNYVQSLRERNIVPIAGVQRLIGAGAIPRVPER